MTGWLIVNEYLNTDKFTELTKLFLSAADSKGVILSVHTNAEFVVCCDGRVDRILDNDPDFIIFYDKDIELARAFEKAGIRVYNRADAIEVCDSKYKTARAVEEYNRSNSHQNNNQKKLSPAPIPAPKTYKVPFTYENIGINKDANFSFLNKIADEIGYPMVIKESYSSFGMGVHLAHNEAEAIDIICKHANRECVIQEYIKCSADGAAKDVRLQMVGDKCVAAMMRSNDHDFRANLTNGGTMSAYAPTQADNEIAVSVMRALRLDFAGIDIMLKESEDGEVEAVFCEANSNAHFKNLYDLTGVNAAEYMFEYIEKHISGA